VVTRAYTEEELKALLEACGFADPVIYPSLMGQPDEDQPQLFALVARKPR
jgi:hypothetical protein